MEENNKIATKEGFKNTFQELFNLHTDKASNQAIIDSVRKDAVFKGSNLWILIFAIIICSVGLDINSTAVIIGGMLISPLMGPLIGLGMGVSRNDLDLIKTSGYNISVAIVLSVLTSAIYFYISPLHKVQSELLSRTSPAFWDVLIAFAGGFAGIIAYTRKEKNNVIPGVAIATALMPPLSTAGFGLATGNFEFFRGALYLFFINSLFISIGTYIVIQILNIRRKKYVDPQYEKKAKRVVFILIILAIIPSIFTAVTMVQKNVFEKNVESFVSKEFNFKNTLIISKKYYYDKTPKEILVTLYGEPIDSNYISIINSKLDDYDLTGVDLRIMQGQMPNTKIDNKVVETLRNDIKTDLMENIYQKNYDILTEKDERIKKLEKEVLILKNKKIPLDKLGNEALINFPSLEKLSLFFVPVFNGNNKTIDTIPTTIAEFKNKPSQKDLTRLKTWLKTRIDVDTMQLIEK